MPANNDPPRCRQCAELFAVVDQAGCRMQLAGVIRARHTLFDLNGDRVQGRAVTSSLGFRGALLTHSSQNWAEGGLSEERFVFFKPGQHSIFGTQKVNVHRVRQGAAMKNTALPGMGSYCSCFQDV